MTNCSTPARQAEIAAVPEFNDSTIDIVAGLVLPVWTRPPNGSMRVYRHRDDAGERIIGRKLPPAWVRSALTIDASVLTPDDIFAAPTLGQTIFSSAQGFQLRPVRMMGAGRIELSGLNDTLRDPLKAYGLFHQIISWKLRAFVPADPACVAVLTRMLDRHPVERIGDWEAV